LFLLITTYSIIIIRKIKKCFQKIIWPELGIYKLNFYACKNKTKKEIAGKKIKKFARNIFISCQRAPPMSKNIDFCGAK